MKQFEVGKTYKVRSICNHDCVWSYKVIKRTSCTITVSDGEEIKTLRINKKTSEYKNAECVYPLGHYSMCPILSAEKAAGTAKIIEINH